jgi:phosphorylcholine metabolism protein LicD
MNQEISADTLEKYPEEVRQSIIRYLEQLCDKERIAYSIAKEHLGTSFDVVKSIGYIAWKKSQSQTQSQN